MRYNLTDKELGRINLTLSRTNTRIIGKWRSGEVHISAPMGTPLRLINQFIENNREWFNQRRPHGPMIPYHIGFTFKCLKCEIRITEQETHPGCLISESDGRGTFTIAAYPGIDLNQPHIRKIIRKHVLYYLKHQAEMELIPIAWNVAREYRLTPTNFKIGSGLQRLGLCSEHGEITLSCALMMLPPELIRYVVCHELAHLTQFNHSPAFHELLNKMLDGREVELKRQIDAFPWPIDR